MREVFALDRRISAEIVPRRVAERLSLIESPEEFSRNVKLFIVRIRASDGWFGGDQADAVQTRDFQWPMHIVIEPLDQLGLHFVFEQGLKQRPIAADRPTQEAGLSSTVAQALVA